MTVLVWAIRLVTFLFLAVFAFGNTDPVRVQLLPGSDWQAPLIVVLLLFFVAGVLFGLAALLGTIVRQRRDIARLQRGEVSPPHSRESLPPV